MGMKSDMNDNCESGIVLSNSVVDMCIVNPPVCLHTLCAYSWHAHAVACRLRCVFPFSIGDTEVLTESYYRHLTHAHVLVLVCVSCHGLGSLSLVCPCRGLKKMHVKFVLDKVELAQIFVQLLQFSLPVSLHWCFMLIYSSVTLVSAVDSIIK
jgi:hypothetical protein